MNMRHRLIITLASLATSLLAQKVDLSTARALAGSLSGTVVTADGQAVSGATVLLRLEPNTGVDLPGFSTQAITNASGAFSLRVLPVGTYTLCPQAPDQDIISTCDWVRKPPQVEILNGGSATTRVVMARGHRVKFQVNDASRVLESNASKAAPPSVTVGVTTPFGFLPARPTGRAAVRRDYEVVVPYAFPSDAMIIGSGVDLEDDQGKKAANRVVRIPLRLKVGDPPTSAVAKITGVVGGGGRL